MALEPVVFAEGPQKRDSWWRGVESLGKGKSRESAATERLGRALRDPESPLALGKIQPTTESTVKRLVAENSEIARNLTQILVSLVSVDQVIADRLGARAGLRALVQQGGPTAPTARRELALYDQQQISPLGAERTGVLPQLSPDAPLEQQEGQRERRAARYRAVVEAHDCLAKAGIQGKTLWNALQAFLGVAFPDEPTPNRRTLRGTYLPRGREVISRAASIPATLDEEIEQHTGISAAEWLEESNEIFNELCEQWQADHQRGILPPLSGHWGATPIDGGEAVFSRDSEHLSFLEGPHSLWRDLTETNDYACKQTLDRDNVCALVNCVKDEHPRVVAKPLEERLLEVVDFHHRAFEILTSYHEEHRHWKKLLEVRGTSDCARIVLDTYERWDLALPWCEKGPSLVELLSVGENQRTKRRQRIDAIVERVALVLFIHTLREHRVPRGRTWLWAHRLLAIAAGNHNALELPLGEEAGLREQYRKGVKLLTHVGVPNPPTHLSRPILQRKS